MTHNTNPQNPVELAYIELNRRLLKEGKWVYNDRTGERCLTLIRHDIEIDLDTTMYPLATTRRAPFLLGIGELIGYMCAYSSAAQFRAANTRSWDGNANGTEAWLANKNRKGTDDVGLIYGGVARNWPVSRPDGDMLSHTVHEVIESMPNASQAEIVAELSKLVAEHKAKAASGTPYQPAEIDLIRQVYENLKQGKDNRGEAITFWNPGMFHLGALRPCMFEHWFSLINRELTLNSTQRSVDMGLGLVSNLCQVYLFGKLMAQITGNHAKKAHWTGYNIHLYESHVPLMEEQITRPVQPSPEIWINPEIKTLEDIETWVKPKNDFKLIGYNSGDIIDYEFIK